MQQNDQVLLHTGSGDPTPVLVKEIVGHGPMPTCYKVLNLKEGDKVHKEVVYHADLAPNGKKCWSLLDDDYHPKEESRQGSE